MPGAKLRSTCEKDKSQIPIPFQVEKRLTDIQAAMPAIDDANSQRIQHATTTARQRAEQIDRPQSQELGMSRFASM